MMTRLRVAALVFLMAACGSTSPTAPTQPTPMNVAGTWNGTYASGQLGFGTATLALTQTGSTLAGTWSSQPSPGGGSGVGAGTVSGTNPNTGTSGSFDLTLTPSDPRTCPIRATVMVFLTQSQMTGQWVSVNCTVTASGTLILTKA